MWYNIGTTSLYKGSHYGYPLFLCLEIIMTKCIKMLNYAKRHSIIYLGGEGMRIKIKAPKRVKCSIKVNLVVLQFELAFEY